MGTAIGGINKVINLFENLDQASLDFLRSQKIAQLNIPSVVINDDGFLPAEVDSPIQYFCKLSKNNHRPLFFDKLPLPNRFWRIQANAQGAQVMDLTTKRADIHYQRSDNRRLIKQVDWYNQDGKVAFTDHYDQHGFRFAQTFFQDGQSVVKKYYNLQGQLVLTHLLTSDNYFLTIDSQQHHFPNTASLMTYYLRLRHYNLDHLLYNTLNQSLQVSDALPTGGEDVLFWHEQTGQKLPGNMKFLMEHKTRTKKVVFQRYRDWQRLKDQLINQSDSQVDFNYLGMIYPHPRGNELRARALIFTNSDQILHLEELVKLLPNVHFTVAAVTEMSNRLLNFGRYENVTLYPRVSDDRAKKLVKNNDIYLDINEGNEIVDAVRGAFEQNMLILGFKSTLHDPQFVAEQNIFADNQAKSMAQRILAALVKPILMKKLIDTQRREAGDVLVGDYQDFFKGIDR